MTDAPEKSQLLDGLQQSLDMLQAYRPADPAPPEIAEPLPSLLRQLETLLAKGPSHCIRTIHHFAATGGSLISKCVSAQPNIVMLSEADPLSLLSMGKGKPVFSPRSVIDQLRYSLRGNADDLILPVFQAEITALRDLLQRRGQTLVIRDHAHSQYCVGEAVVVRPTLRDILLETGPLRSVVTVRHPVDSFLSVIQMNWNHFSPLSLDEYARRYVQFLDDYDGVPIYRYEDFLAGAEQVTAEICKTLDLRFEPGATDLHDAFKISGSSGRSGGKIEARPRRPVPPQVREQALSDDYLRLCQRLNYDPSLD